MDYASQVLAQSGSAYMSGLYHALAGYGGVPRSTLFYRAHGRRTIVEKAQSQQYFDIYKKQAVVQFLL